MLKTTTSVINASQIATPITFPGDVTLSTGNLVIGTAGKGIDFSITSSGSGTMTSELFADYEEGTWTPSVSAGAITGTGITYTGIYTKIGRAVYINLQIKSTASDLRVLSYVVFSGVPFTVFNASSGVVTSEDVDLFVSNGFVGVGSTSMILSACGSAASTNTLNVTVTAYVP
jgi:hypothetical protein